VERADATDPRLADLVGLNDPSRRRRVEGPGGVVVAEGRWVLEHALAAGLHLRVVLVEGRLLDATTALLGAERAAAAPVLVADRALVERIAGFHFHRGVLATFDRPPPLDPDALFDPAITSVAVLEGVNDHENLGALCRHARALGLGALLLDPTSADHLYRRAIRVSMGHALRLPVARATVDGPWAWPGPALARLAGAGYTTLALTPGPDAEPIAAVAVAPPTRPAFVLGAEGPGLSSDALAATARRVRIPLAPGADSLNVATAAALAFHRLLPDPDDTAGPPRDR
jgi:tRNA G18 (ribose-2'-O)-methylase SpoU